MYLECKKCKFRDIYLMYNCLPSPEFCRCVKSVIVNCRRIQLYVILLLNQNYQL
jgi:hypothetical protein